jgi:hypothetical protein
MPFALQDLQLMLLPSIDWCIKSWLIKTDFAVTQLAWTANDPRPKTSYQRHTGDLCHGSMMWNRSSYPGQSTRTSQPTTSTKPGSTWAASCLSQPILFYHDPALRSCLSQIILFYHDPAPRSCDGDCPRRDSAYSAETWMPTICFACKARFDEGVSGKLSKPYRKT